MRHVLAALVWLPAALAAADSAEPQLELSPFGVGYQAQLHSEILDENRLILVGLPDDYRTGTNRYPVIYVLDGAGNFGHVQSTVEVLARAGRMPRSIVVCIANVDRGRDFTAVHAQTDRSSGGAEDFLSFIEGELIPAVDDTLRTEPHRTLVGHSLGGLLAFQALISRPGVFQAYVAISPALTSDEREVHGGVAPFHVRAERFIETRESLPCFVYITMSGGENEDWHRDLARWMRVLKDKAPSDLEWQYHELPDEDHVTTVIRSTLDGLRALYSHWDGRGVVETGDLAKLKEHYSRLSQRYGYEIPVPEQYANLLGYRLLGVDRIDDAIEAFEFNVANHPDSPNVYDSLGEALERKGHLPGALVNYRKAVVLGRKTDHPSTDVFETNMRRIEIRLGTE